MDTFVGNKAYSWPAVTPEFQSERGPGLDGRDRPFSDIGASREQTVCMGNPTSAVPGILGFVLRDSAGFARE